MKFHKTRAVVIGGAGFIGSHVVQELLAQNYSVVIIDKFSTGKKERIPEGVQVEECDIRDYKQLLPHIQEGDVIFHLAALVSVPLSLENPLEAHEINVRGTYNVFEVARVKKASGVIFSSSAAVYGNHEGTVSEATETIPESPYGLHKLLGEQLASMYTQCFSLPTVSLRYFNVYGKGNNESGAYAPVTARFLKQKRENSPLTITGDGSQTRDFVHVRDIAKANVLALSLLSEPKNYCINIATGKPHSIKEIAEIVGGEIQYQPARNNEIKESFGDNTLAKKLLNWIPEISLEDGIKELP